MTSKTAIRIGLCGLAMSLGCNVSTMIGEVPDGSVLSLTPVGTSGHTCQPPQFTGDHPFTTPAEIEGVWTGFVQGSTLGLTSDAVKLTLDQGSDGSSQIHVAYGSAPPPPPATVATDYYPPGAQANGLGIATLVEGYSYVAHNVNWQAFGQQWRLRFMINQAEPWGSWCRLQSSYVTQQSGGYTFYGCAPNTGFSYSSSVGGDGGAGGTCFLFDGVGYNVPWPCAPLLLCGPAICACDECGCDMQGGSSDMIPVGPLPYVFDLLFGGDSASGNSIQLMRAVN
jgi:hypothetical protein